MRRIRFGTSQPNTGLWLIPFLCAVAGVGLSVVTIAIDRSIPEELVPRSITGDPDAALIILSTVAASMVSLTALVLTITSVVVQLAMGQFSPRSVRPTSVGRVRPRERATAPPGSAEPVRDRRLRRNVRARDVRDARGPLVRSAGIRSRDHDLRLVPARVHERRGAGGVRASHRERPEDRFGHRVGRRGDAKHVRSTFGTRAGPTSPRAQPDPGR